MNVTWLVVLIVFGIVLVAGLVFGLVSLILFLVRQLGGTTGGWRRLVQVYPAANPPSGRITKRETIQVGAVTYKRCVTLGIADEGLYVAIWRKTALIPWTDFKALGQATLFWRQPRGSKSRHRTQSALPQRLSVAERWFRARRLGRSSLVLDRFST